LSLDGAIDACLTNEQSDVTSFPLQLGSIDAAAASTKLNQLRSLAHELRMRRAPEGTTGAKNTATGNTASIRSGLDKWGRTVNMFQACHKREHLYYSRWATIFTVVVVALNALIGGAIFSSISEPDGQDQSPLRWAGGVLSLTAGIFSAVRSALRLETVSEQHASAARRFAKLYVRFNDMSQMLNIDYTVGKAKKASEWQEWFKDYMDVMEQAPIIKDSLYDKVRDEFYKRTELAKEQQAKEQQATEQQPPQPRGESGTYSTSRSRAVHPTS